LRANQQPRPEVEPTVRRGIKPFAYNEKRLVVDGTKLTHTVSHFSETAGEALAISRLKGRDFIRAEGPGLFRKSA
jgi:hypothetical protein